MATVSQMFQALEKLKAAAKAGRSMILTREEVKWLHAAVDEKDLAITDLQNRIAGVSGSTTVPPRKK